VGRRRGGAQEQADAKLVKLKLCYTAAPYLWVLWEGGPKEKTSSDSLHSSEQELKFEVWTFRTFKVT